MIPKGIIYSAVLTGKEMFPDAFFFEQAESTDSYRKAVWFDLPWSSDWETWGPFDLFSTTTMTQITYIGDSFK